MYKVGDRVKILRKPDSYDIDLSLWLPKMDQTIGETATVIEIHPLKSKYIRLKTSISDSLWFPASVLSFVGRTKDFSITMTFKTQDPDCKYCQHFSLLGNYCTEMHPKADAECFEKA